MQNFAVRYLVAGLVLTSLQIGCGGSDTPIAPDVYGPVRSALANAGYEYNQSRNPYQPGDVAYIGLNDSKQIVELLCNRMNSLGPLDPMAEGPVENLEWNFRTTAEKVIEFYVPDPIKAQTLSATIKKSGIASVSFKISNAKNQLIDEATYKLGQDMRPASCKDMIAKHAKNGDTILHIVRVLYANVQSSITFDNEGGTEIDAKPFGAAFGGFATKDPQSSNTIKIGPARLAWGIVTAPEP